MNEEFMQNLFRIAEELSRAGWAEANAGNISVRLRPEEYPTAPEAGPWQPLAIAIPALAGEHFLVTAKGCQIRNVPHFPRRDCGVLELNGDGTAYRVVWGLEGTVPTSEFFAHLLSHAVRKEQSGGAERVILHTHPVTLVALCHVMELDSVKLTRLLWSMHPEGVALFPGGIAYLPFALSGSREISAMTCEAFQKFPMVLWEYHGVFASGRDLDHAFGMIQAAEKCANIYKAACELGGVTRALRDEEIAAMASFLHLTPAPGILHLSGGTNDAI